MTRKIAKDILKSLDYYLQNRFEDYGERNHDAMMMAIEALQHQKVGKWKKIKAVQYFVGGYSCSICQTVEEQPLEYCNCCGARMEVEA